MEGPEHRTHIVSDSGGKSEPTGGGRIGRQEAKKAAVGSGKVADKGDGWEGRNTQHRTQ